VHVIRLTPSDDGVRLGLLADTHCEPGSYPRIPAAAIAALGRVELAVHLGDIVRGAALDGIAGIPTVAVRSRVDPPADGHRIVDPPLRIIVGDRVLVALSHPGDLGGDPQALPAHIVDRLADGGERIDLLAYRGSHHPALAVHNGCVMVDPGSPTAYRTVPTVARVTVRPAGLDVEIVDLRGRLDRRTRLLRFRDDIRMRAGDRRRAVVAAVRGGRP
jgi:predicted phosphodiesterase